jgi:hypothetical protein
VSKQPQSQPKLDRWIVIVGAVALLFGLVFLAVLVILSIFGLSVPEEGKFSLNALLALTLGIGGGFLAGGTQEVRNVIAGRIPFIPNDPLRFSLCGSGALFLIILLVAMQLNSPISKHAPSLPEESAQPVTIRDSTGKPELSLNYRIGDWPTGYELWIEVCKNSNFSKESRLAYEQIVNPAPKQEIKPLIAFPDPHVLTVWYRLVISDFQNKLLPGPGRSVDLPK